MKTIVLFLIITILVSSCASNIMTQAPSQVKAPSYYDEQKPETDSEEYNLGHSPADFESDFCQECAHHCMYKNKSVFSCKKYICRCNWNELS
ncbi:unnamed protein product [Thlaspi arvense]|uniref:Uncharacterized protein n=1 Tax=Thlaspi arvense TaxID=13288 RepID=A0AAU9SQ35_THLAR|nr:unnamed protein product [Thlaspi arvense]